MRYNGLSNFIYNPAHIVETKTPVSNPCKNYAKIKL